MRRNHSENDKPVGDKNRNLQMQGLEAPACPKMNAGIGCFATGASSALPICVIAAAAMMAIASSTVNLPDC